MSPNLLPRRPINELQIGPSPFCRTLSHQFDFAEHRRLACSLKGLSTSYKTGLGLFCRGLSHHSFVQLSSHAGDTYGELLYSESKLPAALSPSNLLPRCLCFYLKFELHILVLKSFRLIDAFLCTFDYYFPCSQEGIYSHISSSYCIS